MAVVVAPEDVEKFLGFANEENLEAVPVAVVTKEPRLVLSWRGKEVVNISRAFLDTNGAHQETTVEVEIPNKEGNLFEERPDVADVREKWLSTLADLNVCSQKGLVEMFDSSIGAGSVLMPYGGKNQLTETQAMVAKVPVQNGTTNTVTMMSYGFDPYLSSWSPYHGAAYAVTESVARIVAAGGDYKKIRFTFQEYFRRMTEDPKRWSQPFAALLGAYAAQIGFGLPSIGGKDSMSGTFQDIDVPPTLVSFAVDMALEQDIITPELKKAGNKLVWLKIERDENDLPVYDAVMDQYGKFMEDIQSGKIVSALENNSPNYKKLDSIQNVINCYNEAKALINKTSFDGISNVRIRISRAHELSSMPHLCNCREIVDGLNKLPLDIHSSHYRYIESIPGRFRNYRSYDRDSYSRNTEKLFEAMNDYSTYAGELYGLSYRVSALKEECGDIYTQAIEYYNWQDACTENTQEAYRHYLDLYPDGPHSGEAKQNMQEMNNY